MIPPKTSSNALLEVFSFGEAASEPRIASDQASDRPNRTHLYFQIPIRSSTTPRGKPAPAGSARAVNAMLGVEK